MKFKKRLISAISVVALFAALLPQASLASTTTIAEWRTHVGTGMNMTDGIIDAECLVIGGSTADMDRASFDIDNNTTFTDGQNYYIKVDYKHDGAGFFFVEYKNTDGEEVRTDFAYCDGSGGEGTATLLLDHPRFNAKSDVDFKISTALDRSSVSNYSEEEVKITSVTLYTDGTYQDADVNVTSNNVGNIFYTGEEIKLKMYVKNLLNISQDIIVKSTIYSLDKDDVKREVSSSSKTIQVDALTKNLSEYVVKDCDMYGRYLMTVELSGGERGINVTKSFEFSRAVYSRHQNATFGVNAHTGRGRGSSEKIMDLAQNAGIGLIRETYNWEAYEPNGDGQRALTNLQTKSLQDIEDNGLKALIVIYGNNRAYESGDFVTDNNMVNYANYIKSFVQEEDMKNVTHFEIYNEPDFPETKKTYNGEVIKDDEDGTADYKRGVYYAKMLITAYDAIKSVRADTNVSALSFCRVVGDGTDEFLKGAASIIKTYYEKNKKLPFDDVSVHPYIGNINPEKGYHGNLICLDNKWGTKSIQEIVEYWKNFFNEAVGCTNESYPLAITEYGWINRQVAESYNPNYADNEHDQAVLNLRAYLVMKAEEFEQKNYVYNFMNDGLRLNTQEHNYGMIRNNDYRVPYAAKAEYLSVAALNNFIADATACSYEESGPSPFHNVLKFTKPTGCVYVVWTTSTHSKVNYDFGNAEFYDMYGNKLNSADVKNSDGTYKISTEPYYAVTGGTMFDTPVKKSSFVDICGNIQSGDSGVPVSLTVLPKEVEFDENMLGSIKYLDQSTTFDDGGFEFRVRNLEHEKWYTAYVSPADNSKVLSFDFRDVAYPTYIELYSGINKIDSINLGALNTADNSIKVHIADGEDISEYTVGVAYYKADKLQSLKTGKGKADGESIDVSITEAVDFDTVKIFMWSSTMGMLPLCRAEIYVKSN